MSPSFGDEKWWDAFQDDALRDLIRAALQQNYDVRIAAARILEARALLGIARADQLPEVNAAASVANERSPEAAGRPPSRRARHRSGLHSPGSSTSGANSDAPRSLLAPAFSRKSGRSVKSSVRSSAMWRPPISSCANRTSNWRSRARRSRRGRDSLRLTQLLADRGATSMLDVRQAEQLVFGAGPRSLISNGGSNSRKTSSASSSERTPEGIARGRSAGRPATSTGGSRGTSVIPARTPPGHPPGGAAAGRGERADRRRQSGLFPANLVDGRRRISEFRSHPAVRRSGRAVDHRRQRAATDL